MRFGVGEKIRTLNFNLGKVAKLGKQVKTNEMETGFQETKLMVLKRVIEKKDKTMRVKSTVDY